MSGNFEKKHIVTNVHEYLEVIKEIKSESNIVWYRGQPNASYWLIPSVMRNMQVVQDQYFRDVEPHKVIFSNKGEQVAFPNFMRMLNEFKEEAASYLDITPKNNFEWLFLAQHYGLPTPLLDWSTDPLVGLFFATDGVESKDINEAEAIEEFMDAQYSEDGVAIYAMDPCEYNSKIAFDFEIVSDDPIDVNENYELLKGYLNEGDKVFGGPLCIKGTLVDRRLCRQSGNFTIHGKLVWPVDYPDVARAIMHKIFIPYSRVNEIKEYLKALDITRESIYGKLNPKDKISEKIAEQANEAFSKNINELKEKYSTVNEFTN